ncbi:PRAME family member 9/15-like [Myotis lucifugus]|uniref:PRAME family member 9/15-like n=1 Tax=Myotis lucifugus TaxID=59463 RepID=UPI0003C430A4|nr:PRAME family member 9/15-like [Myotis lucifugus]
MSIRTAPTLLRLAGRSLLRDQASAIAALGYLPAEFFQLLFIQACRRRMWKPLKVLVQAWPFPVLPLRSLMRLPPVMVLKAVLEGLDGLLAQKDRPRRCKLRVLDLRNTGANYWRMWCGDSTCKCLRTEPVAVHSSSPNMEHPLAPLEVFLDLNFNERDGDEFLKFIIQWAQQREGLVHLCCKALRISEVPFQRARRVLDGMLRLRHLQDLNMYSPSFLQGRLDQMPREQCSAWQLRKGGSGDVVNLTQPKRRLGFQGAGLHQIVRTALGLEKSVFSHLLAPLYLSPPSPGTNRFISPQSLHLRQLKSLRLYGASLLDFSPEPLQALLEAVAPTLQGLGLDNCGMADSQVEAILPVLSRCHQLRDFTIPENNFPVATVEKLLRHTCYGTQGTVNQERLALIRAELTGTQGVRTAQEHPACHQALQ